MNVQCSDSCSSFGVPAVVVILSHAQHQQFSENLRLTQAMLLPSEKKKKRPLFKVENNSLSNQLLLADQHVK